MGGDVRTLIDRMLAAGDLPDPEVLEAILVHGEDAVGPLMEVLEIALEDPERWDLESLSHVAHLLGSLRAAEAVPLLVRCLREGLVVGVELAEPLGELGDAAIEPAFAVADDGTVAEDAREAAVYAAGRAVLAAPEAEERVASGLRERLAAYLERADALGEEEFQVAAAMTAVLAELRDPQDASLLERALTAGVYDRWATTEADLRARHEGRTERILLAETSWLEGYREEFQEFLAESHWEEDAARAGEARLQEEPPLPHVLSMQPQRRTRPDIGRNDPCWCGSGKKYKHCHWAEDQRGQR